MSAHVDDSSSALGHLQIVLEHLSGPDGSLKLYRAVARGLHRASKQHHAAVRSTVRELVLRTCCPGTAAGSTISATGFAWKLLAACPALTSLQLHLVHLEGTTQGSAQQPPSAGQLRKVDVCCSSSISISSMDAGLRGLGRLLRGCSQLQEVVLSCGSYRSDEGDPSFHLMLDPDSSSMQDVSAPAPPLRLWRSHGMPYGILARWVAQQPLGRTLQSLTMTGGGWTFDLSQLTPLTGLRHLHLDACTLASSSSLSSFSSLQTLVLDGRMDDVGAVQALTGLQRLTLHTRAEADTHMAAGLFSALRPLRHLTHLHVTHDYLSEVPAELGEWAPRLEDVAFKSCRLRTVPSSLTCLKRLELDICPVDTFSVPTTLTCLRTLLISASFRSIAGLDACTALEFLAVTGTEAFATSLPSLRPLTRLCHLDLHESNSADPAALTVVGALQQLTYLNLRHSSWVLRPLATMWSGLAVAAALPGLQQLEISYWSRWGTYPVITGEGWFPLATLGPWLSGCTALTKLVASGNDVSSDDELLYLPAGLRELAFQSMTHRQLQQLPCGLSRLSALRVLDASCNPRLCQLPSSLARLQRLEALSLQGTGVVSEQAVLAQMPNLKRVGLPVQASAAVVFGAATHIVNGLTPSVHMDDGGAVYSVLHQLMAAE